jgi:uncharacterized SAM-binding protein YcdF (DUF218 family)
VSDRVVVILGAAVWPGGEPSPTLARRTDFGIAWFRRIGGTALILSGGLGDNPPSEARVMEQRARVAGIDGNRIVLDETAKRTIDTARFVADWLGERRDVAIFAITDPYHALRTRIAFRTVGLRCVTPYVPYGQGTSRWRRARSTIRELPALVLYALRLLAAWLS